MAKKKRKRITTASGTAAAKWKDPAFQKNLKKKLARIAKEQRDLDGRVDFLSKKY